DRAGGEGVGAVGPVVEGVLVVAAGQEGVHRVLDVLGGELGARAVVQALDQVDVRAGAQVDRLGAAGVDDHQRDRGGLLGHRQVGRAGGGDLAGEGPRRVADGQFGVELGPGVDF